MKTTENTTLLKNPAYQETKQHTDTMFAFNIYPCTIPSNPAFVPLHWQDSIEIIYIKQGMGIVQVDFETFPAEAGDIFLVMPGHLHSLRSIPNKKMIYENIIFDMSFLGSESVDLCSQKYLQPVRNGTIAFPSRIKKEDRSYPFISACLDAADNLCSLRPDGYELGVKGQMLTLFSLLFQMTAAQASDPADDKAVQKLKTVLHRIEQDYDKKLTVADMARECGYSTSHFMRWFKNITGTGFLGYLIEYRLNKAAQALHDTTDTVLEISEQSGFDNLSNFNRLFKKRFGMTPSQFRRQPL